MGPQPTQTHKLQTQWMRDFARTYQPTESGFWFSPSLLQAQKFTLIDLTHALRVGEVVDVDALNHATAIWIVRSVDCNDQWVLIVLAVQVEEIQVSLLSIERIQNAVRQIKKNGENDVA